MKKILVICMLILSVNMMGCSSEKKIEKEYKSLVEDTKKDLFPVLMLEDGGSEIKYDNDLLSDNNKDYEKIAWTIKDIEIISPAGILCREKDLLVVDKDSSQIVCSDYEGNMLKCIGTMGNGKVEFMNPTGIAAFGNMIYIIDSGNKRVQVLDENFQFVKEIKTENESDPSIVYENIAVESEDTIYLCGDSLTSRSIDKWKNGEMVRIEENYYGSLYGRDGKIYAVNIGNIAVDPNEKIMTVIAGKNNLFQIKKDKMYPLCELPEGLVINAFVVTEDSIVLNSNKLLKVYIFGKDGEYEKQVAKFDEWKQKADLRNYLAVQGEEAVWISNPSTGEIFCMRKK